MERSNFEQRLSAVRDRIAAAAKASGRAPDSVALLAVSKGHRLPAVEALAALGQRRFGESYVSELDEKVIAAPHLEWHFIGPVQSNKTRPIAAHFDWVHSVDREKILRRLEEQRPAERAPLNICIQVNIDAEPSKSGVEPAAVLPPVESALACDRLQLRGLMAIPRATDDVNQQRRAFARVREVAEGLAARGIRLDTLSMGMSDDLEAAIAEGATIVRVGTALFGPRARPTDNAN